MRPAGPIAPSKPPPARHRSGDRSARRPRCLPMFAPPKRRCPVKLRNEKLVLLALAVAALVLPWAPAVANPPTAPRWHVVVSTSPQIPQDVWFAGQGNNTDGWTSGGSICLNQLAQ